MTSLTDPLTLMREFAIAKKPIALEGEYIVIGRTRFPRAAKTAYRNTSTKDTFYQIDSVWSILQNKKRAEYVQFCGLQNIPVVHLRDRKSLLDYLQGGEADTQAIDYSQYVAVQPVSAEAAADAIDVAADGARPAEPSAAAASSKPSTRPREPTAEEARQLEEGRKAFKRLLTQAQGAAAGGGEAERAEGEAADAADAAAPVAAAPMEVDDAAAEGGGGAAEGGGGAAGDDESGAAKAKGEQEKGAAGARSGPSLKELIAEAKPYIRHDREQMGAAVRRERAMRSRSSILLAPTVKAFPVLSQVLDGFRKRNKMAIDMEEKAARKHAKHSDSTRRSAPPPPGASAAGASAGAPPASGPAGHTIPPLPPHLGGAVAPSKPPSGGAPPSSTAQPVRVPRPVASGGKGMAVIAVPGAITAIVNMFNVPPTAPRTLSSCTLRAL
jgi:hypothetical protein